MTDKLGYSARRAQKQMCAAVALWFVSQTTLLLWLAWSVSTVPHSFMQEKIPVLHHIFEHFLHLSQPGDANIAIPKTGGHGEGSEESWAWDGGSMVRL